MILICPQIVFFPNEPEKIEEDKKQYYFTLKYCFLKEENESKIKKPFDEEELISILIQQNSIIHNTRKLTEFIEKCGLIHCAPHLLHQKVNMIKQYKIHYEEIKEFYIQCNNYYEKVLKEILPDELYSILSSGFEYFLKMAIDKTFTVEQIKQDTYAFFEMSEKDMLLFYRNNEQKTHYYYQA